VEGGMFRLESPEPSPEYAEAETVPTTVNDPDISAEPVRLTIEPEGPAGPCGPLGPGVFTIMVCIIELLLYLN